VSDPRRRRLGCGRQRLWREASTRGDRPSDDFAATASVALCLLTSRDLGAPLLRLPVLPSAANGVAAPSWIMVDKILTVPRSKIGHRIGALSPTDLGSLDRALAVFLGIAGA
jgi:mRNA interferase MazF